MENSLEDGKGTMDSRSWLWSDRRRRLPMNSSCPGGAVLIDVDVGGHTAVPTCQVPLPNRNYNLNHDRNRSGALKYRASIGHPTLKIQVTLCLKFTNPAHRQVTPSPTLRTSSPVAKTNQSKPQQVPFTNRPDLELGWTTRHSS